MRRRVLAVAFVSVYGTLAAAPARGQTALHKIGELDVPLLGLSATLDPPNPVVPKNTASGIRVVVKAGGRELSGAEVNQLVGGSFVVQAELAGPGLPGTISVPLSDDTTSTDSLLLRLPALTTAGDYALSNARIVVGGRTVLDTTPADVTVNVIDQVLITSVKTKPLTLDEIKALGIVLDNDSYQGFSFTLGMKVDSKAVSFSFPVVFNQAGVQVPQPLSPPPEPPLASVQLPSLPPVTVVPMLLSGAGGSKGGSQKLVLPGGGEVRIPAVLVIPGNVGYLKQFFSAQLFVANGAPAGSGLVVHDVTGTITLPPGADQVLGTADDPLTLPATNKGPQAPTQAVKGVGPDGAPGTADDTDSFAPGEQGVVEFAIRAEKEGLYTVDFEVNAVLEGLPVGPVNVSGTASGGVLVRNPYFNVTFTVPSVVRTGERFHLFTTVTNIGSGLANAVTVSLDQGAMSGATLVGSSSQQIPTLRPGDSRQLDFEFRSLRTGQVVATYLHLDTSDGSTGKLQFTLGVGERGIPLSPDTLVLPTAVDQLPSAVVDAAMRVLGQAWSIANAPAGTLPAGVTRTSKGAVTKKALALAEAGLRVTLGQSQADAVRDLALDFFSAPPIDAGFDQLLRETDAGHALAIAIGSFLEDPTVEGTEGHAGSGVAQAGGALEYERQVAQLAASGPDFISFAVGNGAAGSSATVWVEDRLGRKSGFGREATAIPTAQIPGAVLMPLGDPATSAVLGLVGSVSASPYTLYLTSNDGTPFDISVTVPRDDGTFLRGTLRGVMLPQDTPARVAVDLSSPEPLVLQQDVNHDATFTGQTPFAEETLAPQGPTLVSATVIGPSVLDGASPYGMQAILVFDRIVDAAGAGTPANYAIPANSVFTAARQMSGRLVTLALTAPEGPYIATTVSASGIADLRGATANGTVELHSLDQLPGAVVTGRVLKADGTPVTSGSVIYSNDSSPTECAYPAEVGLTQIALGGDGRYGVHYVVQGTCGLPFEVTTQDPVNGETRKASAHVLYAGQVLVLDITLLGRGAVTGTVYDGNNRPAPGAHVTAVSSADLQSGGTAVTDIGGHYTVEDLAVGPVSVTAALGTALGRAAGRIDRAGTTDTVDVTLDSGAVKVAGVVWKVENGKSSAAPGALVVYSIQPDGSPSWLPVGVTYTGTDGSYAMTVPGGKYSITASVDQAHSAEIHGTATPPVTIDGDIAVVFQPPQSY
ncbi:MAG TPA: carboxypeptidase regulatory-like domain-containing protein, partial [Kineosporiaceae bacterium]|nr:carboxypeptidase regulatory-like domain-containing protein [Kineosporiaceae bacterium]